MQRLRPFAVLTFAVALATGCGMFDGHGSRRHGGGQGQGERCDVDLDQWKARVRHFKQNERQNRDSFRTAQNDLTRDLERLDTAACRREIRKQVDDLLDEVREEKF
jgi:hypothetical protein